LRRFDRWRRCLVDRRRLDARCLLGARGELASYGRLEERDERDHEKDAKNDAEYDELHEKPGY
jgi:hypothetical protein